MTTPTDEKLIANIQREAYLRMQKLFTELAHTTLCTCPGLLSTNWTDHDPHCPRGVRLSDAHAAAMLVQE